MTSAKSLAGLTAVSGAALALNKTLEVDNNLVCCLAILNVVRKHY